MKMKIGMLSFAIVLLCAFSSCKEETQHGAKQALRFVKTATVKDGERTQKLVFNGTVKEERLTTLSFRVGGPMVAFNVNTGDFVQEGDVIASIDKRDYHLQVEAKRAQLQQLEGEYNRYKELFEKNKIPANSYEKIESGYLQAKAGFENAVNQLEDTDLKAPFSGYIYEKMAEAFQTVGPGVPIVSLLDKSLLRVTVSVPENQISDLSRYKQMFLSVKNAGASRIPLKILSVGEKAKSDGMYELTFSFNNNSAGTISPGMSAEVTMSYSEASDAISIPSQAVFSKNDVSCVWIYRDTATGIEIRPVNTGAIHSDGTIEIRSGLEAGETIITAGVHRLFEGENVRPIEEPSESNVGGLL